MDMGIARVISTGYVCRRGGRERERERRRGVERERVCVFLSICISSHLLYLFLLLLYFHSSFPPLFCFLHLPPLPRVIFLLLFTLLLLLFSFSSLPSSLPPCKCSPQFFLSLSSLSLLPSLTYTFPDTPLLSSSSSFSSSSSSSSSFPSSSLTPQILYTLSGILLFPFPPCHSSPPSLPIYLSSIPNTSSLYLSSILVTLLLILSSLSLSLPVTLLLSLSRISDTSMYFLPLLSFTNYLSPCLFSLPASLPPSLPKCLGRSNSQQSTHRAPSSGQ